MCTLPGTALSTHSQRVPPPPAVEISFGEVMNSGHDIQRECNPEICWNRPLERPLKTFDRARGLLRACSDSCAQPRAAATPAHGQPRAAATLPYASQDGRD